MTASVTVEQAAYVKSILHAARYPSCPILGLLLGRVSPTKPASITIVDALPLFHHHPVGPLLEVALLQAEAYARSHSGGGGGEVSLVGVYCASAVYDRKEVSSVAQKVANKIADYGAGSVLMSLDNAKVGHARSPQMAFDVLVHANERWSAVPSSSVSVPSSTLQLVGDLLARGKETLLVDFEYHIDNAHAAWDNAVFA